MNLHSVHFKLTNIAIWLRATGRNGRDIGHHLWVLPEGEPSTRPDEPHNWNRNYWRPERFSFQPFNFNYLMREGYVQPLCGHRSQSQRPYVSNTGYPGTCDGCLNEAARRGIVPLTYNQAQQQSTVRAALDIEERDWEAAGRPSPWPPSPSET